MCKNTYIICRLCLSFLFILVISSCQNKEIVHEKKWYKGNLHAHSYWSDGNEFPEMIMDWYKKSNYQFTVLSDHNTLAEGDKWITLSDKTYLQDAYKTYLAKYGQDWVESRLDSSGKTQVKLKTYAQYQPLFEEKEVFTILKSEEITTGLDGNPIHINAANIQEVIQPLGGNTITEVIQNNIDAVNAQRKKNQKPILTHLNHPNFHYGISPDDLITVNGLQFFEVYNGHPAVNNDGDSLHVSTEQMWDQVNVQYQLKNRPLLYGLATDDSHRYHIIDKAYSNTGMGWVMVKADSLNATNLVNAMEMGQFYSSTGVSLKSLNTTGNKIDIEIEVEDGVDYEIVFIGLEKGATQTKVIKKVNGYQASYTFSDQDVFVRAKVISSKSNPNFFDETEFEKAWVQPMLNK